MENQESSVEIFEEFKWKIENFSRLNDEKIYSEPFILCGYPWRILLFPKGNTGVVNHLSIYLEAVKTSNMSEGWSRRDVKFKLLVFNQLNTNQTITDEAERDFNAKCSLWGFRCLIALTNLHYPKRGFIVNDACIVGAEVYVCKSSNKRIVNEEVLGSEPKVVCNDAELVSAALGRVIYFLKTKKLKDMNEQACMELQVLWNELKNFQFDVTWLEPHVQYALGMKSYVEKALEDEKLKENMLVLEIEIERLKAKSLEAEISLDRLKAKSIAAEVNLHAERRLLKTKGFEKIDLDSQLGYGS